jgi:hypothetical protein
MSGDRAGEMEVEEIEGEWVGKKVWENIHTWPCWKSILTRFALKKSTPRIGCETSDCRNKSTLKMMWAKMKMFVNKIPGRD